MNPENNTVRNSAIFKVVGLFLLCLLIGLFLLKSTYTFTITSDKKFKKELEDCQKQMVFVNNTLLPGLAKMSDSLGKLPTYYSNELNPEKGVAVDDEIASGLFGIGSQKQNLLPEQQGFLPKIIGTYTSLRLAYKEISKLKKTEILYGSSKVDMAAKDTKISQLEAELVKLKEEKPSGSGDSEVKADTKEKGKGIYEKFTDCQKEYNKLKRDYDKLVKK